MEADLPPNEDEIPHQHIALAILLDFTPHELLQLLHYLLLLLLPLTDDIDANDDLKDSFPKGEEVLKLFPFELRKNELIHNADR